MNALFTPPHLVQSLKLKKIIHDFFVKNKFIEFISSPALSIIIPPIILIYYTILDIWGDDWEIIKNYKDLHSVVFTSLAAITILILFLKSISEHFKGSVAKQYQEILESIVVFFNSLVKKKKDRFFQKSKNIKPNADIFKIITQPKDQLDFLIDGTQDLLQSAFGINKKHIEITIIQGALKEEGLEEKKWWYSFQCDHQKQHTKANQIMKEGSTAYYCYTHGESILIPDIRKGSKEATFQKTYRSEKSDYGSIYCKPVRIKVNTKEYLYIFTIVIYGEFICTPYDIDECKACERLLDEIADRVELELYLHSLKQYKESRGKS